MATHPLRTTGRFMIAPSVILLLGWMVVPLSMTLWFSFQNYNLLNPGIQNFIGLENYIFFITDPAFFQAISNTFVLVIGVLCITILGGIGISILLDQPMFGQGIVRIMMIAPFLVMPTVSALVWKNMFMNPVNGLFAHLATFFGFESIDFFADYPLLSIIIIVAWQWLPFATLIFLTALQSLDQEQIEAAKMDGARKFNRFYHIVLPHLASAITVVILIQTIFLLSIFAEIMVTTNGGPGYASTNITYLVYAQSLLQFDVGGGSAGGIIAVILANIIAVFFMRLMGKNLEA